MVAVSAGYVMSIPTSTPYRLRVDRLEGLVADERGERKASGSLRVTLSSAQKIQQEQHPGSQTGLRWKPSSSWKRPISRRFWQHAGMHFWQQQTWWEGLVTIWWKGENLRRVISRQKGPNPCKSDLCCSIRVIP